MNCNISRLLNARKTAFQLQGATCEFQVLIRHKIQQIIENCFYKYRMERHKSIYYQLHKTCAFPKFVSALNTFLKEVLLSNPKTDIMYGRIQGRIPSLSDKRKVTRSLEVLGYGSFLSKAPKTIRFSTVRPKIKD